MKAAILSAMAGLVLAGTVAAAPAFAQDTGKSGHHGVSRHDHEAAAITQRRKLQVQHAREAEHEHRYREFHHDDAPKDGDHPAGDRHDGH